MHFCPCRSWSFCFPVPIEAGRDLLPFCLPFLIEKTRYEITVGAHTWEIDEFQANSAGLVVAEIELRAEDEAFERPLWLGPEVSHDRRYTNSYLSEHPFCTWSRTG